MKVLIYSAKSYEIPYLEKACPDGQTLTFLEESLSTETAFKAIGFDAVSIFSADEASSVVLKKLKDSGVKYIALRSTGYDYVNLYEASRLNIKVANVPAYSPNAIAEHAVGLLLALNRKLIPSYERVSRYDFSIDGLKGFDLAGKTVGIIGTGHIGSVMARIMKGFGCELLGHDIEEDPLLSEELAMVYTDLPTLCQKSDVISIHTPLTSATHHLIDERLISKMKKGVIIINTARGAVIHSEHVLRALENGQVAALGMDVYEYEHRFFFRDFSEKGIDDTILKKFIEMPNVLITSHHAFLTHEALSNIAKTTFFNLECWQKGTVSPNEITAEPVGSTI